jgi:hypothetical protein
LEHARIGRPTPASRECIAQFPRVPKPWTLEIFSSTQLRQRANEVLNGIFPATGLPEPPGLKREEIVIRIANIMRSRFPFPLHPSPKQLTEAAAKDEKIVKLARQLLAELKVGASDTIHPRSPLSWYAGVGSRPDWDEFIHGLCYLERAAQNHAMHCRTWCRMRREDNAHRKIAQRLAPLYYLIFQRKPSRCRDPITKKLRGPFLEFIQYIERETNPFAGGDIAFETIDSIVWPRNRKAAPKRKRERKAMV